MQRFSHIRRLLTGFRLRPPALSNYPGQIRRTGSIRTDSLSPFWRMMEHVFHFTFARQNAGFGRVYNVLKDNPHIPVPVFVAADEGAMVFEYTEGYFALIFIRVQRHQKKEKI